MLRVTVEDLGTALRLKVEGRLAGAWVPELEQCWRALIRRSPGVGLIVDLTDTEFVDLALGGHPKPASQGHLKTGQL